MATAVLRGKRTADTTRIRACAMGTTIKRMKSYQTAFTVARATPHAWHIT